MQFLLILRVGMSALAYSLHCFAANLLPLTIEGDLSQMRRDQAHIQLISNTLL
jgi:hypothetical protein